MIKIELKGFKELSEELRQLGPRVAKKGLRSSNWQGAMVIVRAAERTSAFQDRTGQLRKGIWAFKRPGPENKVTHAVGVKGKESKKQRGARRAFREAGYAVGAGPGIYGRFLEFGTSKMHARSFLRPAFLQSVTGVIETIRVGLQKAVDAAVKKRNKI